VKRSINEININFIKSSCNMAASCNDDFRKKHDEALDYIEAGQYNDANQILEDLATKGCPSAYFHLGLAYKYGIGLKIDNVKATDLFNMAHNQRSAFAHINVDVCYVKGERFKRFTSKAFGRMQKAAMQGCASAQFYLALGYLLGIGTEPDYAKAKEYIRKALEQGYEVKKRFYDIIGKKL